jgi:hypothetical protein
VQQKTIDRRIADLHHHSSAYLLEPADVSFRATGRYSLGREVLPASLAVPLKKTGDALGLAPFMGECILLASKISADFLMQSTPRRTHCRTTSSRRRSTTAPPASSAS